MAKDKTVLKFEANTDAANKRIKELEDKVKKLTQAQEDNTDAVKKGNKELGNTNTAMTGLDSVTGGAISKFRGFKTTLKGVTKGFKTMRLAVASTGIGLLVIAIGAMAAAFTGSEEGQNKFNKIMTVTGALVGNFVDLLADLGEKIIGVFTDPIGALKSFGNSLKTFITDKINGAIEGFGLMGSAIKKVFSGDFSGALDDAGKGFKKLNDNLNPTKILLDGVVDGFNAATKATKEFIKEQENELKAAQRVADMRAKADKIERKLKTDSAKLESEVANLRLKAKKEDEFTNEQRIKFLEQAQALEDKLLDKQTEYLTLRRDAQVLENTFSRSNKANLDKEAEAIAAVSRQEAARANKARQLQTEKNAIVNKQKSIDKADDAEKKRIAKELADYNATTIEEQRVLELDKLQQHYDTLKLSVGDNEEELLALKTSFEERKQQMKDKFALEDEKKAQAKYEKEQLKAESDLLDWDTRREMLQQQRDTLIGDESISEELRKILLTKNSEARQKIDVIEANHKKAQFDRVAGFMNQAAELAGKETAEGKAVASAAALINTYSRMSEIWGKKSDAPTVATSLAQKIAASAAVLSTGFKTVKSINSVKVPKSSGSSIASISKPSAPSFNVVGQSPASQQDIAQGAQVQIDNNNNNPQRAYVVSTDITNQQSLDRDIEDSNSLG